MKTAPAKVSGLGLVRIGFSNEDPEEFTMKTTYIIVLATCAIVAACGDNETVAGIDAGGSPSRVGIVSKGSIAGFGSVIVNGVRFDTSGASFDIDGSPGNESDLNVGQIVLIQGMIANDGSDAIASSVSFGDRVQGPISNIDQVVGTITVLGQLVRIDADTSFDESINPASIEGLAVNDIVEVSGLVLSDGTISATRIEIKPAGGEFEVTGIVSNLGASTFEVNGLVVDFSAAQLDDFPGGSPENGQLVEVKGTSFGPGGEFEATRVEFQDDNLPGDQDTRVEIEGFITRFVSASDFDVEGVGVTTNASTTFVNGGPGDLALNRKVEVEGTIDAADVLVATKVEIKLANFIRIETLVDAASGGQLTMFGISITTNLLTRFEDKSIQDVETFAFSDVQVGDYIEMRGFENASGIVATLVEREDFDGDTAVRGFVESVSDPNFSILGVTIVTSAATVFRDNNDQIITAAEFFSQANGRLVEGEGTANANTIIALEVEFED